MALDTEKITPQPIRSNDPGCDAYELVFNTEKACTTSQGAIALARRSRAIFHLSKSPVDTGHPGREAFYLSAYASSLVTKRPGDVKAQFLDSSITDYDEALKEASRLAALHLYDTINNDLAFIQTARENLDRFMTENNMSWKP